MAINERTRHELHVKLEEVLGPEEASTLMAHLPPTGWGDVATKRDLDHLAAATKRDLDQLAVHLEDRLGSELREVRLELQATKSELLATFRKELHQEVHSAVRSLMALTGTLFVALAGLAFAAARLT